MNSFRKIFAASVMMTTILSLCIVSAPSSASAAASAGDLIKINGSSSVYYLGANGKRYVFPNEATYFSWYKDFSGVVTVSQSEIEGYPLAANIVIRPGTKMVKSPSISTVYAVEPSGVLRSIVSEENAKALWGDNWNKKVVDVIDAFFTNYTIGAPLTVGVYPAGQLFKTTGSPDVYVQGTDGKARKFASEAAFLANNYNWDNIQSAGTSFTMPSSGSAVAGREDSIADVSQGGGTGSGVVAGTGMTVALAFNTPASATIPQTAPSDFLKFNVTAANDGAVTINSIKLTAIGLGNHTSVDGVTVYVDGARVGNAKEVNSDNYADMNFSTGVVIPAGQTKSIVVRANIASPDTNNHGLSIAKASDIVATGAVVSGSFPISGNLMTGTNVDVGTMTVTAGIAPSDIKLGDKEAVIARFDLANNNYENINVSSITLKKSGTVEDNDFENLGLYVGGSKVASAVAISNKVVTFNFNTPYLLEKNKTKKFDVKADIVDGASKNVTLSLESISDVVATGVTYGTFAKITAVTPLDLSSSVTITAGDVALAKENSTNDKVRKDTKDVVLGTIKITPNSGKNVELGTMKITITPTGTSTTNNLSNVELYDTTSGSVYDLTLSGGKYSNTALDIMLASGVTKSYAIRADINETAITGVTFAASLASVSGGDLVIEEADSNIAITDVTPNALSFNAITVQAPALTVSTNSLSSSLNAVVGTSNVQVLSFNLKANSTDALKVTEIAITDEDANVGSAVTSGMISRYRLYKDGIATPIKDLSGSKVVAEAITFDNLDINVPKGEEVKYYVTIDLVNDNALNGQSTKWGITGVSAEDATEGETVSTSGYTPGMDSNRTIEIVGAGSLVIEMDNSNTDTQKDHYEIAGNSTGLLAALKVRGANENITIEDLRIKVLNGSAASSTNANAIFSKLQIVDSDKTTVLKEISNVTAETLIEDINVVIPQSSKTVYLKGVLNPIGKDRVGLNDEAITFRVDGIVAKGVDSNQTLMAARASSSASCVSGYVCYVTDGADTANGTDSSKETAIISSRISSVELVSNGGGVSVASSLSGGSNVVAILKVTTDNTANTLSNGDEIKTLLNTVKFNVTETEVANVSYSIEKANGTDAAITGVASTSAAVTFNIGTSSTPWINDYKVGAQSTVYYVVRAIVSGISATAGASSIQLDLNDLDGTTSGASNFIWQDSSDAGEKYPLRLSTSKVSGTKVTN